MREGLELPADHDPVGECRDQRIADAAVGFSFGGRRRHSLFSTAFITFFGEITPQAYFSRNALKMASLLVPFIRFYQFVLYPVAKPWRHDARCLAG